MGSPARSFSSSDGKSVLLNVTLTIASAAIAWAITEGVPLIEANPPTWLPIAVLPVIYAVLKAAQKFLMDTRPDPSSPTKPL